MTTIAKYLFPIIIVALTLVSCEETVDIDVPEGAPRLVIEADILWEKGTVGNEQNIKLSLSTPFFDTTPVPVTDAIITLTKNDDQSSISFIHQNDGIYTTSNFVPQIGQTYTLEVVHDNETYIATESMITVPEINRVEQSLTNEFGSELIEISAYYDDPADEDNFYSARFSTQDELLPTIFSQDDEFSNGNEMSFDWTNEDEDENDDLEVGDIVAIEISGISERYYNYLDLLLEQSGGDGGPFGSTPAALRGNCVNQTNPDHYPQGYFRLSEVVRTTYTVQ